MGLAIVNISFLACSLWFRMCKGINQKIFTNSSISRIWPITGKNNKAPLCYTKENSPWIQGKDGLPLVINELCSEYPFPKRHVEMTRILIGQFSLSAKLFPKWVLIYSNKVHLSPHPPAFLCLSDAPNSARLRVTSREELIWEDFQKRVRMGREKDCREQSLCSFPHKAPKPPLPNASSRTQKSS